MKRINVVLVRSKYPRNIGMISRVMENFDLDRLILVKPRCELNEEAKQGAAQGQRPLTNVTIYNEWSEFYENEAEGPRIAFSRRQGKRRASIPMSEMLELDLLTEDERPIYLIFGAEDHGLFAEDLEMVHRISHFELPGDLKSMNLSHAVLMVVHAFHLRFGQLTTTKPQEPETIMSVESSLKLWLKALNFDLESQTRWNALTMLNQMIMKATPTNTELRKLDMIIQQTVRKLNEHTPSNSKDPQS